MHVGICHELHSCIRQYTCAYIMNDLRVVSAVMRTCRYCIATRPQLQQQLQQELAAAGISSSITGAATPSGSTCNSSSSAADQLDQDLAPAGPADSSKQRKAAAGGVRQQPAAVSVEVLQQRRQRLQDVFAAAGPELLKQLPLLQACLYEALRLYPAGAPGAPRCAVCIGLDHIADLKHQLE
jgi:cytochrome P450